MNNGKRKGLNPEQKTRIILVALIVFAVLLIPDICLGGGGILEACMRHTYPFSQKIENFEDVTIELVTVEYVQEENEEYGHDVINSVKFIADEDKEAFLEEFKKLDFILPFGTPIAGIEEGKAFCITYPDGQTEIVTTRGCELYTDRSLEEIIWNNGNLAPDKYEFYALWDKWAA